METGTLIARARRHAGLTQAELAVRAGTSQPAVSAYESGKRSPSVATLERLLAACGYRPVVRVEASPVRASRSGPVGRRLANHRRELTRVLARHDARNPRVFGSVARGQDTEASDLDILVELPRPSYVLLGQIAAELSEVLGSDVDVTVEALLRDEAREQALAEAVPL